MITISVSLQKIWEKKWMLEDLLSHCTQTGVGKGRKWAKNKTNFEMAEIFFLLKSQLSNSPYGILELLWYLGWDFFALLGQMLRTSIILSILTVIWVNTDYLLVHTLDFWSLQWKRTRPCLSEVLYPITAAIADMFKWMGSLQLSLVKSKSSFFSQVQIKIFFFILIRTVSPYYHILLNWPNMSSWKRYQSEGCPHLYHKVQVAIFKFSE